jgi:CRISPR system Cascade subunit CasB
MSDDHKSFGQTVLGWWSANIGARESAQARALAARLRRAGPVEALSERAVQDLARLIHAGPAQAETLARMVRLLAEVRDHDATPLAQRLGNGVLSELRFQRLMRAQGEERDALMRRVITMAERRCNVAALAKDLWVWDDATRTRWCFHYFGAEAPSDAVKEATQ